MTPRSPAKGQTEHRKMTGSKNHTACDGKGKMHGYLRVLQMLRAGSGFRRRPANTTAEILCHYESVFKNDGHMHKMLGSYS